MNKKNKSIIISILLIISIILLNTTVSAKQPLKPSYSISNEALVEKVKDKKTQFKYKDIKNLGKIPSVIQIKASDNKALAKKAVDYPSRYDLREQNALTAVKDQGRIGGCWTFAALACLESNLKMKGIGTYDFSESNMIQHHGFDWGPDDGGNRDMSTAYLARWEGPVSEQDDPYPAIPYDYNLVYREGLEEKRHVQDVIYLPARLSPLDNDMFKWAIMNYGAVDSSIDFEWDYFNDTYDSFYDTGYYNYYPNHEINIVGWDDDFSKDKFSPAAPGNGAFIVRNSYGTSFGDDGYFYVSYYDDKIADEGTVYISEAVNNYNNIYQYDPLGFTGMRFGYSNATAWFSNVFYADSSLKEDLEAVSFYTVGMNSTYEVYAATDYDTNNFSNKKLLKSGSLSMAGYHTIKLNSPVKVAPGSNFAVIVKVTTPGELYPIATEYDFANYSYCANANPGESFISYDGNYWIDLTEQVMQTTDEYGDIVYVYMTYTNVCLKAFTKKTRDLNDNGSYDIMDIALIAQKYNLKEGSTNWTSNYDLNDDKIIDLYDLVAVSKVIS